MSSFEIILDKISKKDTRHSNKLKKFIENQDDKFFENANYYLDNYCDFLKKEFGENIDTIVDKYLSFVKAILVEQTRFMRKGAYRYSSLEETYTLVYSNSEYMFEYMVGLAVSMFFWKNHYEMFAFFKKYIGNIKKDKYLEIGCGHGLFFLDAIKSKNFKEYKAIDLSQTSINITTNFIRHSLGKIPNNVALDLRNIFDFNNDEKYDFITMGEVLEHVENPQSLLDKIYTLLEEDGAFFLTTCANSPVIDHIYLFETADEIRKMIKQSGFKIEQELSLISESMILKNGKKAEAINYAVILKK